MRIPVYIKTAQTNLLRTKLRTFLTVFAFVIGTFTLAMTTAFSQGLSAYINTQLDAYGQPNIINVGVNTASTPTSTSGVPYYQANRQAADSGGGENTIYTLTQHDVDVVKAIPLVKAAYPDYTHLSIAYAQLGNSQKYVIQAQSAVPNETATLAAGSFPSEQQATGIVLPYPYVEALGAHDANQLISKQITLHVVSNDTQQSKDYAAIITGVLPDTAHTPSAYVSYQTIGNMVQFQGGSVTRFSNILAVTDNNLTKEQRTTIKNQLQAKNYTAETYDDLLQSFSRPLAVIQGGLTGFAAIALLAATIGIVNTLLMAVLERTQEIGLLKALGMRRRGIMFIYLLEAASIGFWGGLIGVVGAKLVGLLANPILSRTIFKGIGQAHLLAYPPMYMFAIIAGAMLIGLLAGTLPAIRAGKLDPIDALRRE
jgi:putative ABC transport system permease protein